MIQELKNNLDHILSEYEPQRENEWEIYSKSKNIIEAFEYEKSMYFTPTEYHEYINYISDILGI